MIEPESLVEWMDRLVSEVQAKQAELRMRKVGTCGWCGRSLAGKREDAKFCGGTCRKAAWRARKADA
jgi:hypothetical protein